MKLRIAAIAAALLATASVTANADYQFITDYYGYSWETGPEWTSGTTWQMTGILDDIIPPLTADFGANEYTFYLSAAVQNGAPTLVGSGSDPRNGPYNIYQILYNGGRLDVYEDPGMDHDWGTNPINPTSPATFVNGTPYLTSSISNLTFYITQYTTTLYELGSFECDLTFDGGSHLGEIGTIGSSGYSFAGLTKNNRSAIPLGYRERVDGQQFVTPVRATTWGAIKNTFAK